MKHAIMPASTRRKDGTVLMWAYGSNLNKEHMKRRCPDAIPLTGLRLDDCALVFRGVADVEWRRGSSCQGGLWAITKECEKSLDTYEGVKGGLYGKRYFTVRMKSGIQRPVLFYKMRDRGVCPPSVGYLQTIEKGYDDFGLDHECLKAAVKESWAQHEITPLIERRYERKGRPVLGTWRDLGGVR